MMFSDEVRKDTNIYWEASFQHPFVKGIVDSSLPLEKFKFYMMQDAYYLKHYAKVLALAAAKTTDEEELQFFLKTAQYVHEAELALHRTTFKQLQVTDEDWAAFTVAPTTYNYVNHMYNAVQNEGVAEAFAAIFPCPWLYAEIGQYFIGATPEEPLYKQWVDLYASEETQKSIEEQKRLFNRFAERHPEKQSMLKHHFERSCYYELLFWDMSWSMENWRGAVINDESSKSV